MIDRIKQAAEIGALFSVLIFFASATWLLVSCFWLPGRLSDGINSIETSMQTAAQAIATAAPRPGAIDKLLDASTATVTGAGQVAPAAAKAIVETSTQLNRRCAGNGGPDACGTLATFAKAATKAGDAIVTTQLIERQASGQVVTTMKDLDQDALDLDAVLKDAAIHDAAQNLAQAAGNLATGEETANGILLDVKKETDSMVAPKTTKQKIFGWLPTGIKLGAVTACLATGTTCP